MNRSGSLLLVVVLLAVALALFIPLRDRAVNDRSVVVATIPPLAMILEELAGDTVEVHPLLTPSDSPHTYDPTISDIRRAEQARVLFYVSDRIDGWVTRLPTAERHAVFPLVPAEHRQPFTACTIHGHDHGHDHDHGALDPHFWTDPLTVKAVLPALTDRLAETFPKHADAFRANQEAFAAELADLDEAAQAMLKPVAGETVFLFHPSFLYLLDRYQLTYGGAIEEYPGKEPTPQYLQALMQRLEEHDAQAIFTEPQLSRQVADVIRDRTGIEVITLDPLGGVADRRSYADWFRYNVTQLVKGLR